MDTWITLLLCLLPLSTTYEMKFTTCQDSIKVQGKYYKRAQRYSLPGMPADMVVNWQTGDIYFTLISKNMDMKIQMIRNLTLSFLEIDGVGQSTAIRNGVVFVGTSKGVYVKKGHFFELIIKDEDVMYLAVGEEGTLFLSTFPQNGVVKISDSKTERISAIPNGQGLKIDLQNNLYFAAHGTPYILPYDPKLNTYSPYSVMIKGLPKDEIYVFAISRIGKVYVMDRNGLLFLLNGSEAQFLADFGLKNINTFAFDSKGNVLIGIENAIVKFFVYDACYKFKSTTEVASDNNL